MFLFFLFAPVIDDMIDIEEEIISERISISSRYNAGSDHLKHKIQKKSSVKNKIKHSTVFKIINKKDLFTQLYNEPPVNYMKFELIIPVGKQAPPFNLYLYD